MNNGYEAVKDKFELNCQRQRLLRQERIREWKQFCLGCNSPISYENRRNKYCGHSCAASVANKTRLIKRNCIDCEAEIVGSVKRCAKCLDNFKSISFNKLKSDSSRRRWLLKELGYVCQICHITEWRGQPTPVVMDHIDGNSENNVRENLRLVCPNCNAQLPTFAGRNKGRGRTARRLKRQMR